MGELTRKGESRPVTEQDLALYQQAQALQAQQQVPLLQRAHNPHEYLYFALFDGTGQDVHNTKQQTTNIGILKKQLDALEMQPDLRVGGYYVKGIGTQRNAFTRGFDKLLAFSWDEKIEEAYRELAKQASDWQRLDPDAQIRIVEAGYSRGAVLAPGLARLVDRHGIADPDHLDFGRDAHGNITVESPRPPLVAPRQAAQAMLLFDPVATGMPRHYDARLPGSVISAAALLAMLEQREAFGHQAIIDPGLSADRRAANLPVPGGHSNVGGGARDTGLEAGAFNVAVDYLNALGDRPLFRYRELPAEATRYTVYQARGITALPGLDDDGVRDLREELANCKIVDPCRDREPVDEALAARFEYRAIEVRAPVPTMARLQRSQASHVGMTPADAGHPDHAMLERIRAGVGELDRSVGKPWNDASERLSRSLLAASKDVREPSRAHGETSLSANALDRVDHVVIGNDGRHLFAVQGELRDPAHRRAAVEVEAAIRTPVEQSDAKLEAANLATAQERQQAQQQQVQRQQSQEHGVRMHAAPAMP